MIVLTPPAALSETAFGSPEPPLGATLGLDAREPRSLHFDAILATLSHMFRSCRPNGSQVSSWNPKSIQNVSKNDH